MTARVRLACWIAASAGALLAQLLNLPAWISALCVAILAILLCTTPADAIRLPGWLSNTLIVGGSIVLQTAALARGRTTAGWAGLVILVAFTLVALLQHQKRSPWWAILLVWGPWALSSGW